MNKINLYLHDKQKKVDGWIWGYDLRKHLTETGLIKQCYSLEDERVKGWLVNPSSYQKKLKKKVVSLWNSQGGSPGDPSVACLVWSATEKRVIVVRWKLHNVWRKRHPAALKQV